MDFARFKSITYVQGRINRRPINSYFTLTNSCFRPRGPAAEDEDTDDEIERVLRENAAREKYDRRKEENDAEEDTDDEIERVLRESQKKDQQQARREKDDTAKAGVTTPKKKNESTAKEETDRETIRGKYERKENREDDCGEEEEEAARARQPKRPPSRGQSRHGFQYQCFYNEKIKLIFIDT
jgi:hypothetical protein